MRGAWRPGERAEGGGEGERKGLGEKGKMVRTRVEST